MFHLITGMLMGMGFVYLYYRCLAPLGLSRMVKLPLAALLFLACFKLQVLRLLYPGSVVPEVPQSVLLFTGWVYAVVILLLLCSLLLDAAVLARGLARVLLRKGKDTTYSSPRRRVAALLTLACLLGTWGVWEAVRVPDVRRVELSLPGLPPQLDGLRIVQLSDLHISPLFREGWAKGVVERVNALNPDLVVLTGDMVDGSPAARTRDVAPLEDLKAQYGVFACMGNHEYYSGLERWWRAFDALGIRVLVNEHAVLHVGDATLILGGVADSVGARRFGMEGADAARAFVGSKDGWRLLLAHNPQAAAGGAAEGVGLVLSGHTHGGQLFPISQLVALFNEGFLDGLYWLGETALYVSRGVGLWGGFPVRIGAPSEITEITLRP